MDYHHVHAAAANTAVDPAADRRLAAGTFAVRVARFFELAAEHFPVANASAVQPADPVDFAAAGTCSDQMIVRSVQPSYVDHSQSCSQKLVN